MNDQDKWSAHLEYLKVAITLSTAILVVAAAIYSDTSKIPTDASKYALLASAVFVFFTLVASIFGVIYLSNYLIRDPAAAQPHGGSRITIAAGLSFFSFLATGVCLLVFFLMRTFGGGPTLPAKMIENKVIENVADMLKGQVSDPADRLNFQRFEVKGNRYEIDYVIGQGPGTFHAEVDAATGQVESIQRRP
jgi:hypothetical protein